MVHVTNLDGHNPLLIIIYRLPPLPPSSQTRCLDERVPDASIHERGREDELLEVILLDPSDAKRRVLMKKQVSLERGSKMNCWRSFC